MRPPRDDILTCKSGREFMARARLTTLYTWRARAQTAIANNRTLDFWWLGDARNADSFTPDELRILLAHMAMTYETA